MAFKFSKRPNLQRLMVNRIQPDTFGVNALYLRPEGREFYSVFDNVMQHTWCYAHTSGCGPEGQGSTPKVHVIPDLGYAKLMRCVSYLRVAIFPSL